MAKSIRHMEWGGGAGPCPGKKTYKSEASARSTANDQERRGSPPLTVYHCPDCAGFHLTKRPG